MKKRSTIADSVYDTLRGEIIDLKILPGEKLSEYKLASRFKVSRGPVRNALLRLEKEDLVTVKPQVGTIVKPISIRKALDIVAVRLLLEPHAAWVAAQRVKAADLKLLEARLNLLDRQGQDEESRLKLLFEADTLLHRIIWARCGNREIRKALDSYRAEINRIRLATYRFVDGFVPTAGEIRKLYEALAQRSAGEARRVMRQHVLNIRRAIKEVPNDSFERKAGAP